MPTPWSTTREHRLTVASLESDDDLAPGWAVVDGVVEEAAHHVGEAALVPGADDGMGMANELELVAGGCWRQSSDQPLDQREQVEPERARGLWRLRKRS